MSEGGGVMARADIMAGKAHVSLYMKDKLTRDLMRAKQRVNQFGSDMMSLGTKMVAMSAAIATPIAFATKTFADFDDAMRSVKAVTGATEQQFVQLTEKAKELGRTTSFTATEVAQLMTELGRAGFKTDEIDAMTASVMNLARATGTEAAQSAGIVAATLRQFALDAGEAARVADVLTTAANSTFNTVEGLGESLSYAGPVAKELGLSLEDTVAVLGSLGNVGIQGSNAGTALRRLGLISATSGKELKELFGVMNTDAAGNLKPLVQIMDEIGQATETMTATEKMEKFNAAFGILGVTAASVMSGSAKGTQELAEALRNAEGAAASAAVQMDAGLGGAFRIVMSAAEGLQIAIGEALQGTLTGIVKTITELLGKATEWVGKNQELVTTITAVVAGVVAAGASLIAFGISAKLAAVGIGVVISSLGIVKVALAAASAAFVISKTIILAASAVIAGAGPAIALAWEVASIVVATSGGVMAAAAFTTSAAMSALGAVVAAVVSPIGIVAAGLAVLGTMAAVAALRGMEFSGAWSVATGTLKELMAVAKRVGGILMQALGGGDYDIAFRAAIAGLKIALAEAMDAMWELWKMFWQGVWNLTKSFFSNVITMTFNVVAAIAKAMSNPLDAAKNAAASIQSALAGPFDLSIGIDTDGMRKNARAELDALEAELQKRKDKREAETKAAEAKAAAEAAATKPGSGTDAAPVDPAAAMKAAQDQMKAAQEKAAEDAKTAELERKAQALKDEMLRQEQAASRRVVSRIQDFADVTYGDKGVESDEVMLREKRAIAYQKQIGKIDEATAKEAMLQAELRHDERKHQEALKKYKGTDAETDSGEKFQLKSGGSSAATFSGRSLMSMGASMGEGKQVKAILSTKSAIQTQTLAQQKQAAAQLAATKKTVMKHP